MRLQKIQCIETAFVCSLLSLLQHQGLLFTLLFQKPSVEELVSRLRYTLSVAVVCGKFFRRFGVDR